VQKSDFIIALEAVNKVRAIRAEFLGLYNALKTISFGCFDPLGRADTRIQRYSSKVVTNARNRTLEKANIFSGVLEQKGPKEDNLSDEEVSLEAVMLVVAGSGTTAVTLTYLIWAVISHPQIQTRLEEEVASLEKHFTDKKLETLPFLNAVIQETLRLYGAAPGSLPRTVPRGGFIVKDFYIPSGITVSTQSYTLHHDPSSYESPETYAILI
jgi:cytochrome P450